jgi:hypothetical protein
MNNIINLGGENMKAKKAVIILLAAQFILFAAGSCTKQDSQKKTNGVTFKTEELSKPEEHLKMQPRNDVLEHLVNLSQREDKKKPSNIVAQSRLPDTIVNFGYHSFFDGMYHAYMDHRPVVLSPDVIWLLIS